ncbi:hypothetical protein KDH10_002059 [Shewanella vesiculosa]|uniref:hypothetical protein n=1 Tax=Shewanella vesiculosa TaxID=518738 RepID=UPI000F4E7ECD|nr:hypothetical protein [Shewanella vesiculosa]UJL41142.1 hypothetical protein KDH10_002059 [Shewanella vesiculosa]
MLNSSLEDAFEKVLESNYSSLKSKQSAKFTFNIFRVFLDITKRNLHLLDFNRSQELLVRRFIGFIYTELNLGEKARKYQVSSDFRTVLNHIYNHVGLKPPRFPNIINCRITEDVQLCMAQYREDTICLDQLKYYEGWFVTCKHGEHRFVNLSLFKSHYGERFTNQVFESLNRYIVTRLYKTAETDLNAFMNFYSLMVQVCPTLEDLQLATKPKYINCFFEQIFSIYKLKVKANNESMRNFYRSSWSRAVQLANKVFIESNIWPVPPYEIFQPVWKYNSTDSGSNIVKDQNGNAFNGKLVTKIPLSFSDDEAIKEILLSVETDIEHVSTACKKEVDKTMKAFRERKNLVAFGQVKQVIPVGYANGQVIDMKEPANQAATWAHYLWDYSGSLYIGFLGANNTNDFVKKFGLLGPASTLVPFILLLIEQHPKITESWLCNFELFDKHGKQTGFRKAGGSWIAVSLKRRKNVKLAQQVVILNDVSKSIIENIIQYTSEAREWLKGKGVDDWRYMLLRSASGLSKPSRVKRIFPPSHESMDNSPIVQSILLPSPFIDLNAAQEIRSNLGCDSMRASCGVRVYLQTKSVKMMSEALGHENYDPYLLSSYLPKPILDYFQGRWISIFQNALIYEAMKDSDFLFESLDIDEKELESFLRNHGLKTLPDHIVDGKIDDIIPPTFIGNLYDGIITISVQLLKVLNSLVELVENAPNKQKITPVAVEWYEIASFIRLSINAGVVDQSVMKAMKAAEDSPLAPERLLRAIYA